MTDTVMLARLDEPDFDKSAPSAEFASEFRGLLDRFGYQNRFGISLLHTHWNGGGGLLLETPLGSRQAVVEHVDYDRLPGDAIAVQWAVGDKGLRVIQACAVHDQPPPPPPD